MPPGTRKVTVFGASPHALVRTPSPWITHARPHVAAGAAQGKRFKELNSFQSPKLTARVQRVDIEADCANLSFYQLTGMVPGTGHKISQVLLQIA